MRPGRAAGGVRFGARRATRLLWRRGGESASRMHTAFRAAREAPFVHCAHRYRHGR
ncbi:hypothetical protein C7S16_0544 [Burkholderia thailandensis]|uniref:Uncharacterized protein n=1 Tax=Burkholderia thailandensis TaxID=57975 RepID=A0AAW9D0P0_BURTH|nr:hypothetical protein [Burkholderia thailandensis]MDW9256372.1 hypothetical protein [Burkholderia thailandensis]